MSLDDPRITKLTNLIKDSFRVRENQDPVYIDIGGHLARLASKQHQVIFGRRGSGKSCLLVHYHRSKKEPRALSIYTNADEVKTLPYPDLLIRLLLSIGEGIQTHTKPLWMRILRRQPNVIDYLHRLLRGTDLYLKIGTVRHRTVLVRHAGQTIGVELRQDVEEINLDQTFEDVDATKNDPTPLFRTSRLWRESRPERSPGWLRDTRQSSDSGRWS